MKKFVVVNDCDNLISFHDNIEDALAAAEETVSECESEEGHVFALVGGYERQEAPIKYYENKKNKKT